MLCPAIYGSDRLRPSVCRRFGTLRNRNSRIFDAKRHARVEFCIAASAIHDPQLDQSVMTVIGQDRSSYSALRMDDQRQSPPCAGHRPTAEVESAHRPQFRRLGAAPPAPASTKPLYPSLAASRSRRGLLEQPRPVQYRSHRTASATGISSTLAGATPDQYAARPTRP